MKFANWILIKNTINIVLLRLNSHFNQIIYDTILQKYRMIPTHALKLKHIRCKVKDINRNLLTS
ncbi:hypothetical protein EO92_08685 [Methanosarcina sp. 2.H.A.1B.4]|nr:hypothetical protein EO92_08685 [Methanosarcina sp. 2.H.A.1B.4]